MKGGERRMKKKKDGIVGRKILGRIGMYRLMVLKGEGYGIWRVVAVVV
jgi:hypothetical protein